MSNTLEGQGYIYDPFKTDNLFGTPAGFNITEAAPRPPEMASSGVAIPQYNTTQQHRPDLPEGTSNAQLQVAPSMPEMQGRLSTK